MDSFPSLLDHMDYMEFLHCTRFPKVSYHLYILLTKDMPTNIKSFIRNAETWLQEQRRRLRWLRAKSIELGIYNPETTLMKENMGRGNSSPKKDPLNKSEKQKTKKTKTQNCLQHNFCNVLYERTKERFRALGLSKIQILSLEKYVTKGYAQGVLGVSEIDNIFGLMIKRALKGNEKCST